MNKQKIISLLLAGSVISSCVINSTIIANADTSHNNKETNKTIESSSNKGVTLKTVSLKDNNGNVLGNINPYDMLNIVSTSNGKYLVLTQSGIKGYLNSSDFEIVNSGENFKLENLDKVSKVTNVTTILNLRENPSANSNIIDTMPNNTILHIKGKQGDWYKVEVNNKVGFVYGLFTNAREVNNQNIGNTTIDQAKKNILNIQKQENKKQAYKETLKEITNEDKVQNETKQSTSKSINVNQDSTKHQAPSHKTEKHSQEHHDVVKPTGDKGHDITTTPSKPDITPSRPAEKPVKPVEPVEPTKPAEINNAPVLKANNLILVQGEKFTDAMIKATAQDKEDGNLTRSIVYTGHVNTEIPGNYIIHLSIKDSQGAMAKTSVTVTVKPKAVKPIEPITPDKPSKPDEKPVTPDTKPMEPLQPSKPVEKPVKPSELNNAPTIQGHDLIMTEGQKFSVDMLGLNAQDKEDGNLTANIKVLENTVNTAKAGKYQVVVKVTDKQGASCKRTFVITVKAKPVAPSVINACPQITGHGVEIEQGTKFSVDMLGLKATDKEDGNLTKAITVVKNDVNAEKAGTYDVTVRVMDMQGASCTQTFKVTVKAKEVVVPPAVINACPTIEGQDVTLDQGAKFNIADLKLQAMDKEDGNITSSIKVIENNVNTEKAGTYTVKVEVHDKQGAKATKEFKVVVKETEKPVVPPAVINACPEISGHDASIVEGTKFDASILGLSAFDKEDGNLTKNIKVDTSQVNVDKVSSYKVVVSVSDKEGAKATKEFTVNVTAKPHVNVAPVIEGHDVTLNQGEKFSTDMLGLKATDAEDGAITDRIQIVSNDVNTAKAGTYKVVAKVTDKNGAETTKTFNVTVKEDVNTAPVITADESVSLPFGSHWKLSDSHVSAKDKEDGNLQVVVTNNNVKARVPGNYNVTLQAKDSKGLVTTKTITVKIMAKAPTVEAHNVIINEGTKFTNSLVGLHASDCTGKDLTSKVERRGNVNTAKAGTYDVTYTVVDAYGLSSTKTVEVTVKAKPVEGWTANSEAFHNAVAQKMYALVNQYRESKGITPYEISSECEKAANWKSKDMTDRNYFTHKDLNGKQTWEHSGFENVQQENIAQRTFRKTSNLTKADADALATALFNQWKASPGHDAAMLNDWNTGIGFGFVLTDSGLVNATQEFNFDISNEKPVECWTANSEAFHNAVAQKMYALVNQYRESKGITPYEISSECEKAANWKSKDMTDRNYFEHETPDGLQTEQIRKEWENIQGENIAQRTFRKTNNLTKSDADALATALFNQWKASPGHNAAMLDDWSTGMGFGFVLTDNGLVNATQDFI